MRRASWIVFAAHSSLWAAALLLTRRYDAAHEYTVAGVAVPDVIGRPLWDGLGIALVITGAALLVIVAGRLHRRWVGGDTANASLCRRCEYDPRASPDRCPECGQVRRRP